MIYVCDKHNEEMTLMHVGRGKTVPQCASCERERFRLSDLLALGRATSLPYWHCPNDESHTLVQRFRSLTLSASNLQCEICKVSPVLSTPRALSQPDGYAGDSPKHGQRAICACGKEIEFRVFDNPGTYDPHTNWFHLGTNSHLCEFRTATPLGCKQADGYAGEMP